MPKTLANTLLIFTLLVIAVLSWHWLDEETVTTTNNTNTVQMAQNATDYYLEGFEITNVNNNKGRVYRLSGDTLSHYYESGNSVIEQPSVQVFSSDTNYWTGNAQTGNLSADFNVLTLKQDVSLAHHRQDKQPPLNISAQSVTINTAKRQINSDQPVQISSAKWTFKANRMLTDVDNGLLSFDSGVEASYVVED